MTLATVDVNFPVGTNIDLFDVGMLGSGVITAQTSTSYTVVIGDETVAFTGVGLTYTSGTPTGGTITGMQDSYYGATQITLQQLNVPVSALNAFIGAHDNAGAQAALFAGDDVITGGPLEDLFRGYAGNDSIAGGAGTDTLDGGVGNDTLDGGTGGDVIITGGGADVIVIGQGQSQADVVQGWSSSDAVRFAQVTGDGGAYVEDTAADLASAAARANQLIGAGAANVVAIAVGGDVVVYADSADDNGVADDVVMLSGRTLADVGHSNFGLTAPVVTPPTGGAGGDSIQGTAAADTLRGGAGDDTLDAGAGGDTIYTGGGSDVMVVGQGQSLPVYGLTDNVLDWSSNDSLRFANAPIASSEYTEGTAGSYSQAALLANDLIGSGSANIVALAVGTDVAIYADSAADNGVADDVVILTGRTLADVSYTNFGLAAAPVTPPPVTPPAPGGAGEDSIQGTAAADTLYGGAGDDTLDAGAGGDTIYTGGGSDVMVVGQGQSLPVYGLTDNVLDWSSNDSLRFANAPIASSEYTEGTAGSYSQAALLANDLIGSGSANIVALAVGTDVAIYADSAADNGVADDVVILTGRTLADVSYTNFGLAAAPVTPPPVTPPAPGGAGEDSIQGTAAADTLYGGAGNDTIDGGAGGDIIRAGDGADVITVGQGQSLPVYGLTDNVLDWSSNDSLRFANAPIASSEYTEGTAGSYSQAALLANDLIGSGSANIVALAVGTDVAIYADSAADNGVADDVVILTGRTLADVSYTNFGLAAAPVTPPAAPTGLKLDAASDSGVKGDGLTNLSQFRMTGVAEKGASVSLYDGAKLVGTGQADAVTGAFNVAAASPMTDGAHTLSALAANSGGASSYSASVKVTLDTVAPSAPTASLMSVDSGAKGDGVTTVGLVRMDGVVEKGAAVTLYDGSVVIGTATANATTGAYSVQAKTALGEGAHELHVQATDVAGNVGAAWNSNLVIDTKAAASNFGDFLETATGTKETVTMHGVASDATSTVVSVDVFQDGNSIGRVTPANGAWTVTKTNVSDAVHTYTLQTTDAAGNVGVGGSTLILGGSRADKIIGKATNDIIHGDGGADTLTGGSGADVFVYNALDDAALGKTKTSPLDTITDFQSGTDKLDLSDLGHMTFKGQSTTVGAHEVGWYVSSGNTYVTGDVTGDGKADFIIQLKGSLALSGSDFLLG